MKRIYFYTLFLLMSCSLTMVFADVIPGNSHPLDRCVKVTNLSEFPEIVLLGYYVGPMVETYEVYQVEEGKCLDKGYKFNTLNLYWVTKDQFSQLDLKNLDLKSPENKLKLLLEGVESYGGYVEESNPLIKETIEYSITEGLSSDVMIYKSGQISEYNDGRPNQIEVFENPGINNPTTITIPPQSLGFWGKIFCFFSGLFGKGCEITVF